MFKLGMKGEGDKMTTAGTEGAVRGSKQDLMGGDSGVQRLGERWRDAASLKCLYTNAHSMGNKQEELEFCVRSRGHDLIAITETWWDSSHDWNVVMEGYVLFRKDRLVRQSHGVALYVR